MKKKLVIALLATSLLFSLIINTLVPYTVITAEATSSNLAFLNRLTITPNVPNQSFVGQETTINFIINWKEPADVNVLQTIIKIKGNAELVSIGNNAKEFFVREDGTASYINDELQEDSSFPVILKITGAGPVSVDATIAYSDAVDEAEQSTTLELNVVEDSRSLEDVKKESIDEVNKLNHLSKREKELYIDLIQRSSTPEEAISKLNDSIESNRELSIDKFNKSKEDAIKNIDSLDKLTKEQKEDFLAGIELVTNLSEIENLIKEAKDTNDGEIANSESSVEVKSIDSSIDTKKTNYVGIISIVAIPIIAGFGCILYKRKFLK